MKVKANDVDKQNELIGARGNIKKNTKMYIRKLKESKYMKHIYIEALSDFEGGNISQKTHISTGDIQNLQKKLEKYLDTHKLSLLRSTTLPKDSILIPLAETIHTDSSSFSYEIPKQLTGSNIAGTLKQHISYLYIHQQDLMDIFTTYIKKRTSVVNNIISMDKHSL